MSSPSSPAPTLSTRAPSPHACAAHRASPRTVSRGAGTTVAVVTTPMVPCTPADAAAPARLDRSGWEDGPRVGP